MSTFETEFENRLDNCETVAEAELLVKKAKAYETYCKGKKHRTKARKDRRSNKLSKKDILRIAGIAIPGVASVVVAAIGYKQAKMIAAADCYNVKQTMDTRLKMTETLTEFNKNEIIVDKPIKVVNDICK